MWRNGRRTGLKILRRQLRVGSSPTTRTKRPKRSFFSLVGLLCFAQQMQKHLEPTRLYMHLMIKEKTVARLFFVVWRYHPDLNRGIKVLQTFALPLGHGTKDFVIISENFSLVNKIICKQTKFSNMIIIKKSKPKARTNFGAEDEIRTRDPCLGKAMLYHWATPASGGNYRARTYDPLLVRQMLSQLS